MFSRRFLRRLLPVGWLRLLAHPAFYAVLLAGGAHLSYRFARGKFPAHPALWAVAYTGYDAVVEGRLDPNDPEIRGLADTILGLHVPPPVMAALVAEVTRVRITYTSDVELYGWSDYVPTIEEMRQRARAEGWPTLREDCDGRAVFALSLARTCGLEARSVSSARFQHVWIRVFTPAEAWDLLPADGDRQAVEPPPLAIPPTPQALAALHRLGLVDAAGRPCSGEPAHPFPRLPHPAGILLCVFFTGASAWLFLAEAWKISTRFRQRLRLLRTLVLSRAN